MSEWWWRTRCAFWFWWTVPWMTVSGAISAAWAGDYFPEDAPRDSVDEELTYWTYDGDESQ